MTMTNAQRRAMFAKQNLLKVGDNVKWENDKGKNYEGKIVELFTSQNGNEQYGVNHGRGDLIYFNKNDGYLTKTNRKLVLD